jgi:hypothetical protein
MAPAAANYPIVVTCLIVFSLCGGYFAGVRPNGEWRYFSWHPFLMTCGMVGCMGIGAATKKLGGYTNTKVCVCVFFLVIPSSHSPYITALIRTHNFSRHTT